MADEPDPDRLRTLEQRLAQKVEAGKKPERSGMGKGFSQGTRQTVFGLDRARKAGITACKELGGAHE